MNTRKIKFYEEFSCIADQCSFTCCKGWDIKIDSDTLNKWRNTDDISNNIDQYVKLKKNKKSVNASIKMGPQKSCPFLDEIGLCNIVKSYGEDYQSHTCRTFPRQMNSFGNWKEYTYSCACPAVVDLIHRSYKDISFPSEQEGDLNLMDSYPFEFKLREVMIAIIQKERLTLKDRLLLIFYLLSSVKNNPEDLDDFIHNYQNETYLLSIIGVWDMIDLKSLHLIQETNELLMDITENYRNEKIYRKYLKDIYKLAETVDTDKLPVKWNEFLREFQDYETLLVNCIATKIFANCISDDIGEMIMSFQLLITEFIMIRYSAFLLSQLRPIVYSDIRDYIVSYSRMIGYNSEGIIEFWEESFDEAIWEMGYLLLIL